MNKQPLSEYLKENHEKQIIDHAVRASVDGAGTVRIYIHPHGHDGETLDFVVAGDKLHSCPYGHEFGKGHDQHTACDDCDSDIYSGCSRLYVKGIPS